MAFNSIFILLLSQPQKKKHSLPCRDFWSDKSRQPVINKKNYSTSLCKEKLYFSHSEIDGISVNAGICRPGICENKSVRYLIKWHSMKCHMLATILFLIIILVFEEIVHIPINNLLLLCDTPHNTKGITE